MKNIFKKYLVIVILLIVVFNLRLVYSFASSILCNRIPGLSQIQRSLCTDSPDAFVALGAGHLLGSQECQHQFKGYRWNCSQVWKKDVFGHVVIVGSREAAFTYAIASAGAVHSITAACAKGNITLCGCDPLHRHSFSNSQKNHAWKWGGCSADIQFGMKFARKFLDAREIEGDDRSLMNLHNNRVGRKIVKNLLKTECKCHGVSGSCAMKTCWKSLPPFRLVGDTLMKKYNKARYVHAISERNGLSLILKRRHHRGNANGGDSAAAGSDGNPAKMAVGVKKNSKKHQKAKRMELVFIQPSPNYCDRDIETGSLGTNGRHCNRTARGIDGCDLLCCGRGYNTHQINRTWQCNCKFQWCCQVQCDLCQERTEEYTCK